MATPIRTRSEQETPHQSTLFLAFELGKNTWKLGFTIGVAQQPRERTIPAGALDTLQQEITRAKQRFGLPEDACVVSCYEAGRDGFWLHRSLVAHSIQNHADRRARHRPVDGAARLPGEIRLAGRRARAAHGTIFYVTGCKFCNFF